MGVPAAAYTSRPNGILMSLTVKTDNQRACRPVQRDRKDEQPKHDIATIGGKKIRNNEYDFI